MTFNIPLLEWLRQQQRVFSVLKKQTPREEDDKHAFYTGYLKALSDVKTEAERLAEEF